MKKLLKFAITSSVVTTNLLTFTSNDALAAKKTKFTPDQQNLSCDQQQTQNENPTIQEIIALAQQIVQQMENTNNQPGNAATHAQNNHQHQNH